jgi:hypothetical protein
MGKDDRAKHRDRNPSSVVVMYGELARMLSALPIPIHNKDSIEDYLNGEIEKERARPIRLGVNYQENRGRKWNVAKGNRLGFRRSASSTVAIHARRAVANTGYRKRPC